MTLTIKKENCLTFEAEMLSQTHLDHLIPFKWEQNAHSEEMIFTYDLPTDLYSIDAMLEQKLFTIKLFNTLCATIITLNQTLHSYMLSNQNLSFVPKNIFYNPKLGNFLFFYVLDASIQHDYSLLELFRHLAIELNHLQLLSTLKIQTFELEYFQSKLVVEKPSLWKKFSPFTKHSTDLKALKSNITPQKHIYPMLLERHNPTIMHKLYFDHNTIGRDEQSNIYLDDLSISRKHGTICKSGHQYFYKDLLSTNGSKINGMMCQSEKCIVNGDIIQIGEKEFIFIR